MRVYNMAGSAKLMLKSPCTMLIINSKYEKKITDHLIIVAEDL